MKYNTRNKTAHRQPRLPPELVDMVIDHLYNDKDALAACALVAHSWLAAARLHLFYELMIYHDRSAAPFGEFVKFLAAAPHIRVLVKTLCLNGYHSSDRRQGRLDAPTLASVLEHVPALDTFLVVNCFWEASAPCVPPPPQTRICLKNLYITYFAAPDQGARAKFEILRHFAHVDRLKLDHVWLGHFDIDEDHDHELDQDQNLDVQRGAVVATDSKLELARRLRVTSLTLSLADICLNFLTYLWRQPFVRTLTSLTVQDLYQASYLENHEDLMLLGAAMRDTFAPLLTYFELDIPRLRENDSSERFNELNLAYCTHLRSVRLNMVLRTVTSAEADEAEAEENAHAEHGAHGDTGEEETGAQAEAEARDAVAVVPPPLPPPVPYTREEWHSLHVLVRSLPPTLKSLILAIELPPSSLSTCTSKHTVSNDTLAPDASSDTPDWNLTTAPDWPALRTALGRFGELERLVVLARVSSRYGFVCDTEMDGAMQEVVKRALVRSPEGKGEGEGGGQGVREGVLRFSCGRKA